MSAQLGFSSASVTVTPANGDAQVLDKIGVVVRKGKARLETAQGRLVRAVEGVVSTERLEAGRWVVTFAGGEQWAIVKSADCGCSGSR